MKNFQVLSSQTIIEQVSIREFFTTLVQNHLDCNWVNARLDFLGSPFADSIDAELISKEIETLLPAEIPVAFTSDLLGTGRFLQWIGTDNEAKQT